MKLIVVEFMVAGDIDHRFFQFLQPFDSLPVDADIPCRDDDVGIRFRRIQFAEFQMDVGKIIDPYDLSLLHTFNGV